MRALDSEPDEYLIRHMMMSFILSYKRRYPGYGETVICCDGGDPWRRDYFPNYKIRRRLKAKDDAEKEDETTKEVWRVINLIREELKVYMPYKVVHLDHVEGDDAIAVLAKRYPGPHVIVSNDKDFVQLMKYDGIKVYTPLNNTERKLETTPELFLKEQLIRGDSIDDVPNILSDDDIFITPGVRQKSITSKKLPLYLEQPLEDNFDKAKIERNLMMISFDKIPEKWENMIIEEYESQKDKSITRKDIFNYFLHKRLNKMMDSIEEF